MPKLEGPDVSIEISLKEYGIAWEIGETETRFYYGIKKYNGEYIGFDWGDLENNVDVYLEFDWIDFPRVADFASLTLKEWEKLPLICKIQDLVGYYGVHNIFGDPYTEPMTYEDVIADEKESVYGGK